jgi:glycosyltransferase involved in cell wall biosynthesis
MRGIKYVWEARHTGYGQAARAYIRGLRRTGIPLTCTPMVPGRHWGLWLEPYKARDFRDEEFGELCNLPIEYDAVIVHLVPEYYPHWRALEAGKKVVGMTVWETDKMQAHWLEALNRMDALIVPCHWNREVFLANGITRPIGVVPHIHSTTCNGRPLSIYGVRDDDFVFYAIGTWTERKGLHLTLESYLRAFTSDDGVVLVLKTSNVNERRRHYTRWWWFVTRHIDTTRREIHRMRREHSSPARVLALTEPLSDSEMHGLHLRGDCYVSLTRAEGWGLGAYDAAFAGNPVVMTGHGGQLEFLPDTLSYLVDYRLVPAETSGGPDTHALRGHRWAVPDLEHGARLMQEVFTHPEAARERGRCLQAFVREKFKAEKIMREMLAFLETIPRSRHAQAG